MLQPDGEVRVGAAPPPKLKSAITGGSASTLQRKTKDRGFREVTHDRSGLLGGRDFEHNRPPSSFLSPLPRPNNQFTTTYSLPLDTNDTPQSCRQYQNQKQKQKQKPITTAQSSSSSSSSSIITHRRPSPRCRFFQWHDELYPERCVDIINKLMAIITENEDVSTALEGRHGNESMFPSMKNNAEDPNSFLPNLIKISEVFNFIVIVGLAYMLGRM
ncbi:hypothetical protein ACFE04_026365 [Oxalis oulophora]